MALRLNRFFMVMCKTDTTRGLQFPSIYAAMSGPGVTMRLYKMMRIAEIIGLPERLLGQWLVSGVIVPDEKPGQKGGVAKFSLDNLVQIIVIDRLVHSGISLGAAGKISQDYLKGCRVLEWDPHKETTFIWINLDDPADFVMLPDYDFDSVGFVPDSEKSYLVVALKPIYQKVSRLIADWSDLRNCNPEAI